MNKLVTVIKIVFVIVIVVSIFSGISSCCKNSAWNVVSTETVEAVIQKIDFSQTYNKNFGETNTYIFAVKWDGGAAVIEVEEEIYVISSPGDTVTISITNYSNGYGYERTEYELAK